MASGNPTLMLVAIRHYLRDVVDSLCQDGADALYMQYLIKQKQYIFTKNTIKAYIRAQASALSAFVISKTHNCPRASWKIAKRKGAR